MFNNQQEARDKNGRWTNGGMIAGHVATKIKSNEAEELAINQTLDVRQVMEMAKESAPEVEAEAKRIANLYGATVTPINLKSEKSINRKVFDEYGGDVTQVKDAVRNTIIVDTNEHVEQVLANFNNGKNRIKRQAPENFLGYSGNIVNFKTKNGLTAEIQVNTPEMIAAKESPENAKGILGEKKYEEIIKKFPVPPGEGHKYYEQFREITPEKIRQNPALKYVADGINAKSQDYYNKVRSAFK